MIHLVPLTKLDGKPSTKKNKKLRHVLYSAYACPIDMYVYVCLFVSIYICVCAFMYLFVLRYISMIIDVRLS